MTAQDNRWMTLALLIALTLASGAAWALDPNQPPGGNFDLSHWKIQLPTSSNVLTCSSGNVDEKTPADLEGGFANAYFYTGSDGSMVFWVPLNGSRTGSSSYPRSELRERIDPSSDSVNWIPQGVHILDSQCKVLQVGPSNKKTIIGQIHGIAPSDLPLVKFQYSNGKLEALIKTNSTYDGDYKMSLGTIGLTSNITYQIKVVNGLISVTANGSNSSINVFQTDPRWSTNTMYFKAGDYCQESACSNPSNYGARVAFYSVNLLHAPSITNQPASQVVPVGSNVTFSVGALGNPPLRYFWQFNGATMSGKTNATLTIPNVQLTDAGNYSVIITDCVGTVSSVATSSVAALTVNPGSPLQSWSAFYGVQGDDSDADGDGMSNTNEFLSGFNPTSPSAYLHIIGIAKSGNDIAITYLGANGDNAWSPGLASRTNVLECAAGSADGGYTNSFVSAGQTNILSGGDGFGVITNMIDPGGATNLPSRYYRVRVLVP